MNLDITEWVATLLENEFTFIIQSPTRVTNTTKTIIDNYVLYGTPFKHDDILHGSINTYITDYNAIILKINNIKTRYDSKCIKLRPFNKNLIQNFNNNYNKNTILNDLEEYLQHKIFVKVDDNLQNLKNINLMNHINYPKIDQSNMDMLFEYFFKKLLTIQNNWFPIREKIMKNTSSIWFNDNIMNLIKIKNKNYKNWKKYGHIYTFLKDRYTKSKNICTQAIRKAKNDFVENNILCKENNPKAKWKIINSLIKNETNLKDIPDIEINGLKI